MFNGKLKAVTFSYDDGVEQDIRLIEILDKYGLKGTFNLNSDKLGIKGKNDYITNKGVVVKRDMISKTEIAKLYQNHEVAAHTLNHHNLTTLEDEEVIRQVEQDRINLSEICGYEVKGMAYPCGGVNNNEHVAALIRDNTGVQYARTITSSYSFDLQENLLQFNPTVYHREFEKLFQLAEDFVNLKTDKPQIFYIWGHSYEFDFENTWDKFEELCKMISNRDDIFYGTNSQVLLNK